MGYWHSGGSSNDPLPTPEQLEEGVFYMIQCDVDEISFVFLPNFNDMMSNYEAFASNICLKIDELLELEKYTVNYKLNEKGFAGYNYIVNFDDFDILLCFNTDSPRMGVLLKFSGQGLKHFMKRREEDNQKIRIVD